MSLGPIRVLVADDHRIVRESLVAAINASGRCVVVGQAGDGMEAVEQAAATRPDVVVTDLSMPRLNGLEAIRRLRAELPGVRVLVLSMHQEEEYILHAVRAGAAGYLAKDSATSELITAIEDLSAGRAHFGPHAAQALAEQLHRPDRPVEDPYGGLTPREREVFHLVIEGLTTKEVARRLDVSAKTAENHRLRVLDKIGARNTAELVRYAVRKGLLD